MQISRRQSLVFGGGLFLTSTCDIQAAPLGETGQIYMLGDSIFDNKIYVGTQPAVIDQVRAEMPAGWKTVLLARDGAVVEDVEKQRKTPLTPGQFVFVSAGGNDALQSSAILNKRVISSAEVFHELADISEGFTARYQKMVRSIVGLGGHTTLCTIYDPNFDDVRMQRNAKAALTVFNDCITRTAASLGLPILDLRLVFKDRADYANSIEPSPVGGLKMAKLIRRIVTEHDFKSGQTRFYF